MEARDRTSIGLIFARAPVMKRSRLLFITNDTFVIPAGDPNYEVTADFTMPRDGRMVSLQPHMHIRGKEMKVQFQLPREVIRDLLFVPRYDFNGQTRYVFAEPLHVPEGARFFVTAHFDNSPKNLANPNPTHQVGQGMSTTEEMMLCAIGFTFDDEDLLKGRGDRFNLSALTGIPHFASKAAFGVLAAGAVLGGALLLRRRGGTTRVPDA